MARTKKFEFGLLSKSLWHSKRFRSMGDPVSKLVYCYLHTCKHRNSIGCYNLPTIYAPIDLDIAPEDFDRAMDRGIDSGLIHYDRDLEIVLIVDFFRFNPLTNIKHAMGARKCVESLPDCELRDKMVDIFNAHLQEKAEEKQEKAYLNIMLEAGDKEVSKASDSPIDSGSDRGMDTGSIQREHGNTGTLKPSSSTESYSEISRYLRDAHFLNLCDDLGRLIGFTEPVDCRPVAHWLAAGIQEKIIREVIEARSASLRLAEKLVSSFNYFDKPVREAGGLLKGPGVEKPAEWVFDKSSLADWQRLFSDPSSQFWQQHLKNNWDETKHGPNPWLRFNKYIPAEIYESHATWRLITEPKKKAG